MHHPSYHQPTVGTGIIDVLSRRYPCGPGDNPPPSPCGLTFWNHLYGRENIFEALRITIGRAFLLTPGFLLFYKKIGWKGVALGALVSALSLTISIYIVLLYHKSRCIPQGQPVAGPYMSNNFMPDSFMPNTSWSFILD